MSGAYKQVGVLMGGWSSERAISLQSGAAVLKALQKSGVNAFAFDVTVKSLQDLSSDMMDCAFIILHGQGGEDGIIQAILKSRSIPFTGSDVLASALSMNKVATKRIWRDCGIATPNFISLQNKEGLKTIDKILSFPCALKPVDEGSSIGVSRVDHSEQLDKAWQEASGRGNGVIAEQWIDGDEYVVGFVGDEVLPPIRLEYKRPFYDYVAKYEDGETCYHCPCGLSDEQVIQLQSLCMDACQALGIEGWGRVDAMCDTQDRFYLLEVNAIPGMTSHSLVPMAAKAKGMTFEELVLHILGTARRH